MNYNLSIVIPTKDRQYYCLKSVNQIVGVIESSNYNVEIVVYDNSEEDLLQNMILELDKNYIKYFYLGNQLSFIANFVSFKYNEIYFKKIFRKGRKKSNA